MENKYGNKKLWLIIVGLLFLISIIGGSVYLFKDKIVSIFNNKEIENDNVEEKKATATPLLYEVTKEGDDTKIYLFGSIHAADERAYPMQDKVLEAYNNSDYLAVEADIIAFQQDLGSQIEMLKMFVCENGKTLKDYLSHESYEVIVKYMEDNNIYNSIYEMYRPAMIYSLISNVSIEKSELSSEMGIDMYFLNKAKEDNKKILEVESVQMQYDVLMQMSDELYEVIILSYIEQEEQEIKSLENMYEAWLNGNIEKFLELSSETDVDNIKENLTEDEKNEFDRIMELINSFNESLIYDRNNEMTMAVDNYFKEEKNTFVVVGAAHVIGENGLVNELMKLGYKVNLIDYK